MSIRTHSFNGKKYDIDLEPAAAVCIKPNSIPTISFTDKLKSDLNSLITIQHETLHACCPDMTEEKIDRISKDIARFLWRLGYRLKK